MAKKAANQEQTPREKWIVYLNGEYTELRNARAEKTSSDRLKKPVFHYNNTTYNKLKRAPLNIPLTLITLEHLASDVELKEGSAAYKKLFKLGTDYIWSMNGYDWEQSKDELREAGYKEPQKEATASTEVQESNLEPAEQAVETLQTEPTTFRDYITHLIKTRCLPKPTNFSQKAITKDAYDALSKDEQLSYNTPNPEQNLNGVSVALGHNTTYLSHGITYSFEKKSDKYPNMAITTLFDYLDLSVDEQKMAKRLFLQDHAAMHETPETQTSVDVVTSNGKKIQTPYDYIKNKLNGLYIHKGPAQKPISFDEFNALRDSQKAEYEPATLNIALLNAGVANDSTAVKNLRTAHKKKQVSIPPYMKKLADYLEFTADDNKELQKLLSYWAKQNTCAESVP